MQKLYGLSDEQVDYQILDRKTFQRFVGLEESSQSRIVRRFGSSGNAWWESGVESTLFDAVNRELYRHGYIARGGQMVDASLDPAPKQHFSKEEKAVIEQDAMPTEWTPVKRRQKYPDATWTKKHGKSYSGTS